MGNATCVEVYDKENKQDNYQFIAEDFKGGSHIGYVWVEKPWYSPESMWKYYIRKEEYNNKGMCGGAESSGFVDVLIKPETIRPWNQIEKIKHHLKSGFDVKIVKSILKPDDSMVSIHTEDKIPYSLWNIK